jgi:hypothetical protein
LSRNNDVYDSFNDYIKVTIPKDFNDQFIMKTKESIPTSESIKSLRELGLKEKSKILFMHLRKQFNIYRFNFHSN